MLVRSMPNWTIIISKRSKDKIDYKESNLSQVRIQSSQVSCKSGLKIFVGTQGHFAHEPRAVTMKFVRAQKESVQRPSQHTLQNHVVRSQTLKCHVKSHVTGSSTKYHFNEFLFMRVLTHDNINIYQWLWVFGVPWSPGFVLDLPPEGGVWN